MSAQITAALRTALIRAGRLDVDRYARRARHARCSTCGRVVLRGLDCDRVGLAVTVELQAISSKGEAAARILGLKTYDIRALPGGRIEIDDRDVHRIRGRPADSDDHYIVVEHKCGMPPLPAKPEPPEGIADNDDTAPPY